MTSGGSASAEPLSYTLRQVHVAHPQGILINFSIPGILLLGDNMTKKTYKKKQRDPRLNPETRICPKFDSTSIAKFPVAECGEMGMRVLDDCAEEHIM